MQKLLSTTIAISFLLIASGCSTNGSTSNGQTAQQRQACTTGDPHPWCMQLAQTKPLGAAAPGSESNFPTNPEMQDEGPAYPRNPALALHTGIYGLPHF
jgi:hypothetical protein